jgi:hypothetical protein|uniref:Uncharacterized protein n=1 Tax=viral metagenome TaxID=1070528 RepID=A0A6C0ITT2_9ZZZZ
MSNSIANQNQSLHEDVVQAQVVRVIPINNAHEPEATQLTISDDMKKAYSYSYTIKWVSGIDIFFALLYSFYNWYWLFFVLCSYAGYHGAKKFKIFQLYFYFTYEVVSVIVKIASLIIMISDQTKMDGYGFTMSILSIIIGIWVSELTSKLIMMMRHMSDEQLNLLRNIGYTPRAIVYV